MRVVLAALMAASTGGSIALLASSAPTRANDLGAPVIATAYERNDALAAFTFHANIAMVMRHFPWLHFRMGGLSDYRRGDHYVLHLTNRPPFASKMPDIDLSMIDPNMWPNRYRYTEITRRDGDTLFTLQAIGDSTLKSATVAVNPISGAHWVDATYAEGTHIHIVVSSNVVDGFLLPVSLTADVDCPHMPLSADAAFTDYTIPSATR